MAKINSTLRITALFLCVLLFSGSFPLASFAQVNGTDTSTVNSTNTNTVSINNVTIISNDSIEIGKDVKWTQIITLNEISDGITIEIPKDAKDVTVINDDKLISQNDISIISNQNSTGTLVSLDKYASTEENNETKLVVVTKDVKELKVEYETTAPYTIEQVISGETYEKQIKVKSDSALHYENVRSYSSIPEEYVLQGIPFELKWLINGTKINVINDDSFDVQFKDTDGNGLIDQMSWIVPQLSEKIFSINANTTQADNIPNVSSKLKQMQEKLDGPFYGKTLEMVNAKVMGKLDEYLIKDRNLNGTSVSTESLGYYDVIILPNLDGYLNGTDIKVTIKQNQQKIKNNLETNHNAKNVFVAEKLSFVTAKVPISEIGKLSGYGNVRIIGDGELEMILELNISKQVINSSVTLNGKLLTGNGVKVAILDTGIENNVSMPSTKVIKRTVCSSSTCNDTSIAKDYFIPFGHGTHVAGIVAGLANGVNNPSGVASNALLLDVKRPFGVISTTGLALSFECALDNGADIINLSAGFGAIDYQCDTAVFNLIVDEVMDEGIFVVKSAGNKGFHGALKNPDDSTDITPLYQTITDPGCGFNIITVGNLDDKNSLMYTDDEIHWSSSKGPTLNMTNSLFTGNRLKPEIVAPGTLIFSPDYLGSWSDVTGGINVTGTSFAAPHVSGAAAIILEARPEYTSLEIKSALMLGASWTNPQHHPNLDSIALTAGTYEYATQQLLAGKSIPSSYQNHEKLNEWGFGLLDVKQSVDYATKNNDNNSNSHYIIRDYYDLRKTINPIEYEFSAQKGETVRIILSWFSHPTLNGYVNGGYSVEDPTKIAEQLPSNLDLHVGPRYGTPTMASASSVQNNEFVIFKAEVSGTYKATVIPALPVAARGVVETFVISSTQELTRLTFDTNNPPTGKVEKTIDLFPGDSFDITLSGYDTDGDDVTFYIPTDPTEGDISSIRKFHDAFSSVITYTAHSNFDGETFYVVPYDGKNSGVPFPVTVNYIPKSGIIANFLSNASQTVNKLFNISFSGSLAETQTIPISTTVSDNTVTGIKTTVTNVNGAVLEYTIGVQTYKKYIPPNSNKLVEFTSPQILTDVKLHKHSSNGGSATVGYITGTISTTNNNPVSNAGADQTANEGVIVTLDGTKSSDPDGDSLQYTWRQLGSNFLVTLSNPNIASPTFTAPLVNSDTNLTFELLVRDDKKGSAVDYVGVTIKDIPVIADPVNTRPIANAGKSQTVLEKTLVTLDGTKSTDPDLGDSIVSYKWVQYLTSGDPTVTLSNPNIASPTFTAPDISSATLLEFTLIVNDGELDSRTDSVEVTVIPIVIGPSPNLPYVPNPDSGSGALFGYSVATTDTSTKIIVGAPEKDIIQLTASVTKSIAENTGNFNSNTLSFLIHNQTNSAHLIDISTGSVLLDIKTLFYYSAEKSQKPSEKMILSNTNGTSGFVLAISENNMYLYNVLPSSTEASLEAITEIATTHNSAGGIYILDKTTGNKIISIDNPAPGSKEYFGFSVAVNDNLIAVSAPNNNISSLVNVGTVYLYNYAGLLLYTIDNPAPAKYDSFGESVFLTDSRLIVGSPDDENEILYNNLNNNGVNTGSIHIYTTTGSLLKTIKPTSGDSQKLGNFVSVTPDGTKIIAGAPGDNFGAVYIYDSLGNQLKKISNPTPDFAHQLFGKIVVPYDNNVMFVGNPLFKNNAGMSAGNVQVYDMISGKLLASIDNPEPDASDLFGEAITPLDNSLFAVSANRDTVNGISKAGSVYLFNVTDYSLYNTLENPDPNSSEYFGSSLTSTGNSLIVGMSEDAQFVSDSGAIYIFSESNYTPVLPTIPIANAGINQTANEGTIVTLDGTKSTDPNGDSLFYLWTQTNSSGIKINLSNTENSSPTFTAPFITTDTTLVFSLVVNDGKENSLPDITSVTIKNLNVAPVSNASIDQTVFSNSTVTLIGAASHDSDGSVISYLWNQTDSSGYTVTLSNNTAQNPTFTAPIVTSNTVLTFSLIVNDGTDSSVADTVDITITPIQICGAQITTGTSLSFGIVDPGKISNEYTMSIQNSGDLSGTLSMSANDWIDKNGKTVMTNITTKYSASSGNYTAKSYLSGASQDVLILSTNQTNNVFLQLQANLIDSLFSGDLTQKVQVNLTC